MHLIIPIFILDNSLKTAPSSSVTFANSGFVVISLTLHVQYNTSLSFSFSLSMVHPLPHMDTALCILVILVLILTSFPLSEYGIHLL